MAARPDLNLGQQEIIQVLSKPEYGDSALTEQAIIFPNVARAPYCRLDAFHLTVAKSSRA